MDTGSIVLGAQNKAFPPSAWGTLVREFLTLSPPLSTLQTPLLTLDRSALEHNTRTMTRWVAEQGLHLAPHGKTTMAPALWRQLIDAGAWGLTLATGWQAQVARAADVRRILIANAVVDPVALTWLSAELDSHPGVDLLCWADSLATVTRMNDILAGLQARRRVPVIAELGAPGGRTGARSLEEAVSLAQAIADSPCLELAGVGGYEGALAHHRDEPSLAVVDGYLDAVASFHEAARPWYRVGPRPLVTAGGSAYFDRVAARLGRIDDADVLLRSGAFHVHDDGFYTDITPMGRTVGSVPFRSAMHAWVRVISRPEPDLALLDGGKRDMSFDEGLPTPQHVVGLPSAQSRAVLTGSAITALNDQHAFLRLAPGTSSDALGVGSVLRLGLSHPCTALDHWRLIPVVDDAHCDDPRIVDVIGTIF